MAHTIRQKGAEIAERIARTEEARAIAHWLVEHADVVIDSERATRAELLARVADGAQHSKVVIQNAYARAKQGQEANSLVTDTEQDQTKQHARRIGRAGLANVVIRTAAMGAEYVLRLENELDAPTDTTQPNPALAEEVLQLPAPEPNEQ